MGANRGRRSGRKTGQRRHWGRHVQNGLIVLGGGLVLGVLGLFIVMAGGGGGEPEPYEGQVVEKGPGSLEPGAPAGGPSLHFPVTEIDFGRVPLDTAVSYSFQYVNMGDAPLTIEGTEVRMLEGC